MKLVVVEEGEEYDEVIDGDGEMLFVWCFEREEMVRKREVFW